MGAVGLGLLVDGVFDKGGIVHALFGFGSTPSVLLSMAGGAILCFLAVAMLSSYVVQPLAKVIGVPLGLLIRLGDWIGTQVMRVPGLGRAWYVLRRVVSYVLAFLLFMLLGAIVCGILALISAPLALFGLLVSAALSIYAVFRIWRRTETEWPPERPSPLTSQLARENTARNPARTAVTSSSLMIGVALVVFVAVFVNGFKDSFLGALDNSITSDLIIQSDSFSPIPAEAVPAAQAVPDVQTATGIQFTDAKINHGGIDTVNGIDPIDFPQLYKFDWQKGGSDALLGHFQGDEALIEEQFAKSHHLKIGQHFQVTSIEGNKLNLKVVGQYKDPVLMTGISIPTSTFDTWTTNSDPGVLLVKFKPGVNLDQGKAQVAAALKQFPVATVRTNAEYKQHTESQVERLPHVPVRAAGDDRHHLAGRHHQYPGAVGVRAHARDRHAARRRHHPQAAAADGALRERDHLGDRRPDRRRRRPGVRLDPDQGPERPGHPVLGAGLVHHRGAGRGRPGGSAGGDPAGPAGGAAGRAGGAAVRVDGWFHGMRGCLAQDGARWTTGSCKPWLAAVGSDLRFTQIADGAGQAG